MTQHQIIARLISRKKGATPFELQLAAGTCSVYRRLTDLKNLGWIVTRCKIAGKTYGRYFGRRPA